jgi:hypothetical protein
LLLLLFDGSRLLYNAELTFSERKTMMYKFVAPFVLALASLSALPANAQSTAPDAAAQASGLQKIDVKTGEGRELQPGQTAGCITAAGCMTRLRRENADNCSTAHPDAHR